MKKNIMLLLMALNISFVYGQDQESFIVNTVEGIPMSFIVVRPSNTSGYRVDLGGWNDTNCIPTSTQGVVTIPSEVEYKGKTYTITNIRANAFKDCSLLVEINMPESITRIDSQAFYGCSGLSSVTIPNSVTSMNNQVFYGCSSLVSVTIPNGVTYLNNIFENCSSLKEVHFGNAVTGMYRTFAGCTSLTSIEIPNSVTRLQGTFSGCTSLTSIEIPNSVTYLDAFEDCINLETITLGNNIKTIGGFKNCVKVREINMPESVTSINTDAFYGCIGLAKLNISSNTKYIGTRAFYGCSSLTSLIIPGNVTRIGDDVFNGCNLKKIVFEDGTEDMEIGTNTELKKSLLVCSETPVLEEVYWGRNYTINNEARRPLIGVSSLKSLEYGKTVNSTDPINYHAFGNLKSVKFSCAGIGDGAFKNCTNLTSVTFGDGLVNIGKEAFYGCDNITSVELPNSARVIGDYAFYRCSRIKSVKIGDGVISINWNAFDGCQSMTNLDLGNSVQYLGLYSFSACKSLTEVIVPESVKEMKSGVFSSCISLKNVKLLGTIEILTAFSGCTSLESIELPEGIKQIGGFSSCRSLESFTIPNSVTTIEESAFSSCTNLTSVKMPKSLQTIGKYAFWNSGIKSIVIPKGVTKINESAFGDCSSLMTVISEVSNPLSINENVFENIPANAKLYVPYGKVPAYQKATGWKNFKTIIESIIKVGDELNASIKCGNKSVSATFVVTNINPLEVQLGSGSAVAFSNAINGDIIIPTCVEGYDGTKFTVIGIGKLAFKNKSISSMIVPNTIRYIEEDAFSGCMDMTTIEIPKSVTNIDKAFSFCNHLCSVNVNWRNPSEILISEDTFDELPDNAILYVPAGTKSKYEEIEPWNKFSQIVEDSPISVGDISASHGSQAYLPVILNYNKEISGMQFKVTLPEGVTAVEENGYVVCSTTERTNGMTIMGRKDPDSENSYLLVMFSLNGNSISGNEGAVMNIKVNIASDMTIGNYNTTIEDVYLTTSSYDTENPSGCISDLTITDIDYVRGDANGDGNVSVTDIAVVVNCILQLPNTGGFSEYGADANGDGSVTVTDIGVIVDMILGTNNANSRKMGQFLEPQ